MPVPSRTAAAGRATAWIVRGLPGVVAAVWAVAAAAQPQSVSCGERIEVATHGASRTAIAVRGPDATPTPPPVTLVLLPGGAGHIALGADGCPQRLKGNSLIRMIPLFAAAGFATALVDAPSDHHEADGLGGFRSDPAHAEDLGRIIAVLRQRFGGAVWLVGTSRGAISAANAAARLSGDVAADGVVLTSAVSNGDARARKPWVAQSVFDFPLADIRVPLLIVGHADDTCIRSPANRIDAVLEQVGAMRRQGVTVTGGPGRPAPGVDACEGKSPHGFVDQEAAVVAGIARFVRGGRY